MTHSLPIRIPSSSARVRITLDGKPLELAAGATLADVVQQAGHAPAGVGTAVNGDFVARAQRAERLLAEGDEVLLFQPIVGG